MYFRFSWDFFLVEITKLASTQFMVPKAFGTTRREIFCSVQNDLFREHQLQRIYL